MTIAANPGPKPPSPSLAAARNAPPAGAGSSASPGRLWRWLAAHAASHRPTAPGGGAAGRPGSLPARQRFPHRGRATLPCLLLALALLAGCQGPAGRPLTGLERQLDLAGASRDPALGDGLLALISGRGGREQVVLIDLRRDQPVPVPGLNRPDAQPLAVAIDQRGERLAVVRQRQGRTELVLYRRSMASLEPIAMQPEGVPRRVALDPWGRTLAVEVSRDGLWQVDLINLP